MKTKLMFAGKEIDSYAKDCEKITLARQEIDAYAKDCDSLEIGQVRDGGSSFFVVTNIEKQGKLTLVTGDVINDNEMLMDRRMGCGAVVGLWPDLYLKSVKDHHIWGAFYQQKLGDELK